jgi:hypothetical protein
MKRVEFYYDLVSPCSYLAYGRVKRVYKDRAAGPDRDTEQRSLPAPDIHRWAGHYGLPMQFPEPFPFRTLKTMRAALAGVGDLEAFTREAFVLYWEEGGAPKSFEEVGEDEPIREWRSGSVAIRRRSWRALRLVRPKRLSRARPARPSSVASSGRRPSSAGTRCFEAMTGCTSSRWPSRKADGPGGFSRGPASRGRACYPLTAWPPVAGRSSSLLLLAISLW